MKPDFTEEKKLWKQGFKYVAGLDEAGRGPLAGPVVAAAVIVRHTRRRASGGLLGLRINDSKKLSQKQREFFYEKLIYDKNISFGVGIVSEKIIDKINILEATKLAMERAVKNLRADFLLIDGNFTLRQAQGKKLIPQKSIIRGDAKVFSIAAASIIAKVTRDRIMRQMHKKYPQYQFAQHKGYGTTLHIAQLAKFGSCKIHRKSFYPVNNFV